MSRNVLSNINLDMKKGDFLTVIGKVGCGKSSLLYSIMDETVHKSGDKQIIGSIAYVEQEPFIFSASVKDNIIFGKSYNKARFWEAIRVS